MMYTNVAADARLRSRSESLQSDTMNGSKALRRRCRRLDAEVGTDETIRDVDLRHGAGERNGVAWNCLCDCVIAAIISAAATVEACQHRHGQTDYPSSTAERHSADMSELWIATSYARWCGNVLLRRAGCLSEADVVLYSSCSHARHGELTVAQFVPVDVRNANEESWATSLSSWTALSSRNVSLNLMLLSSVDAMTTSGSFIVA